MLTKDDILNATDLKSEVVEVPEWGGSVLVQEMTGAQRDAYEAHVMKSSEDERTVMVRARLVAFSLVGEDGNLLFTPQDVMALSKKSSKALDRVFTVAARMSVLSEAGVQEAEGN